MDEQQDATPQEKALALLADALEVARKTDEFASQAVGQACEVRTLVAEAIAALSPPPDEAQIRATLDAQWHERTLVRAKLERSIREAAERMATHRIREHVDYVLNDVSDEEDRRQGIDPRTPLYPPGFPPARAGH